MNSKKVKKLRQYYRRDLKQKLGLNASFLNAILRRKPKRMPGILWRFGMRFYFNKAYIETLINSRK